MSKTAGGETDLRPFGRSLPMQLMRAREAVMARFRPHLAARGLTEQQWRIIRVLHEADAIDMAELAEHCCILPASLSRMLPALERQGLVTRRDHDSDHRRVSVTLSPRGRRLFAVMAAESEQIYAAIAEAVGPARMQQLYDLLGDVIIALDGSERDGEERPRKRAATGP